MRSVKKRFATEYHCFTSEQYHAFRLSSPPVRAVPTKSNFFDRHEEKNLYCIQSRVTQKSIPFTITTSTPTTLPFASSDILTYYLKHSSQRTKLKITAQNMKQSVRSDTQLQFHKSNLYLQTDS